MNMMIISAKFIPNNGLFTRTVDLGDTDVVINMTATNQSDWGNATIKWRKDGGEEITSQDGVDHYTIQGPVQPTDGGIYEVYYEGERSSGRGSLFRLIVRGIFSSYTDRYSRQFLIFNSYLSLPPILPLFYSKINILNISEQVFALF